MTQTETNQNNKQKPQRVLLTPEVSIITIKTIGKNIDVVAKLQAFLMKELARPLTSSQIFCNPATKEYFLYQNFNEYDISEKLQEIAILPIDTENLRRRV